MIDAKTKARLEALSAKLETIQHELRALEPEVRWADMTLRPENTSEHIGVRGWVGDMADAGDILDSLRLDIIDTTEEQE